MSKNDIQIEKLEEEIEEMDVAGPRRYSLPRHPTHYKPSSFEFQGIL